MAVALALACMIVAIEVSHQLVTEVTGYRARVAALNRRVDQLKRVAMANEKRLANARKEIASRDRIKTILLASDLKTIKLASLSSAQLAVGTVSLSEKAGGALLSAAGLPALAEGQVYDAWWILKGAPPAKAAEFRSAPDGSASAYLDPPPQASTATSFEITIEPSPGIITPTGEVKLRGRIGEERSGGVKKH